MDGTACSETGRRTRLRGFVDGRSADEYYAMDTVHVTDVVAAVWGTVYSIEALSYGRTEDVSEQR